MLAVLVIIGLVAGGLGIGLVAAITAPLGYQDERGFHIGQPHGKYEEEIPLVVPEPKLV